MEKIIILVLLVLAFCIAVLLAYMGVRTGGRTIIKPPEHLRDKGLGIIMKKVSIPEIKKGNCYKNCGNTKPSIGKDKICLNCGSSIIK